MTYPPNARMRLMRRPPIVSVPRLVASTAGLRSCSELPALAVEGDQRLLDEIDFASLEQRLAALRTHPSWDSVPVDVVAATIHAEGGDTSLHPAPAMYTLH